MKGIYIFLLSQVMCIFSCIGGVIIQVQNIHYNANLSFLTVGAYYFIQLLQFPFKKNRQRYGWRMFLKAMFSGIVDAAANAANVYAYTYSDIASIDLLLSLVVPFSIVSNFIVNKQRMRYPQIMSGLATVVLGISYSVLNKDNFYPSDNKPLGDALAVVGAVGYAFSGSINERFSKGIPPSAYLCRCAVGGLIFSVIMMMATEIPTYRRVGWQPLILALPYGAVLQVFYYLSIFIIQHSNAVYFNLATLCTNLYAFVATVFIFKFEYQFVQVVPVLGVVAGVVIFSAGELGRLGTAGPARGGA